MKAMVYMMCSLCILVYAPCITRLYIRGYREWLTLSDLLKHEKIKPMKFGSRSWYEACVLTSVMEHLKPLPSLSDYQGLTNV